MGPLFIITERFDAAHGRRWHDYVAWSGLHQLTEIVSLDDLLCPHVAAEPRAEDWPHIVNEDFMLHFFTDLDYLVNRCGGVGSRNLLCAFRDPPEHPSPPVAPYEFRFEGYDLADVDGSTSALTNCGGFPLAFSKAELTNHGLLASLGRAIDVKRALAHHYPQAHHAQCSVWALFRATRHGAAPDERAQAGDRG